MKTLNTSTTLSHLDATGNARMVDVSHKTHTPRAAVACAAVHMNNAAYALLHANTKGDVFNTARIAGILAAKRCAELIPLCHSLPLSFVGIDFHPDPETHRVVIQATCRTTAQTGVEIEAMTACSVAALTIYDMCKAADKGILIQQVHLREKSGGKSGGWRAP